MRKIPTLFVRDPDDMRHVLPEVHPDCGWVLAGEGVATRKYDGTCVMFDDDGRWWARREVKPGKATPAGFVEVDHDPATEKRVGWEPAEQSGWWRWLQDALLRRNVFDFQEPGTYELCGPKVNGDPERLGEHFLIRHADAQTFGVSLENEGLSAERFALAAHAALRDLLLDLADNEGWEGIVWHHPDGRMAKLKGRDFR
jgi:hypothetical protein